jgi:hypothetical protein
MRSARADPIEPDQNLNRNNGKILKGYSSRTKGGSSGIAVVTSQIRILPRDIPMSPKGMRDKACG